MCDNGGNSPAFDIWRTDHEQDHHNRAPRRPRPETPPQGPDAERIRTETLVDQKRARREARAKIAAAEASQRWEDAIDLPASFAIGKPRAATDGPQAAGRQSRPRNALAAAQDAARAPRKALSKRAAMLASAQAGELPAVRFRG